MKKNMYIRLTESILNAGRPRHDHERKHVHSEEGSHNETEGLYTPEQIEAAGIVVSPEFIGHILYDDEMKCLKEIIHDFN